MLDSNIVLHSCWPKIYPCSYLTICASSWRGYCSFRGRGWGMLYLAPPITLQWRHNDHDGVSNHQPNGCLLNRLFRRRWKKTSKLRVTGLCVGNSPGPVNSPHQGPVKRKMFPFDDVIMNNPQQSMPDYKSRACSLQVLYAVYFALFTTDISRNQNTFIEHPFLVEFDQISYRVQVERGSCRCREITACLREIGACFLNRLHKVSLIQ